MLLLRKLFKFIIFSCAITSLSISLYAQPKGKDKIQLNLQGEKTNGILEMIEKFSGKPVIRKVDLPDREITFNSRKELTKEEALAVLESLLSINGIMLTDIGEDFLKATQTDVGVSEVPRLLTSDVMDLPPSQKIYSILMDIKYISIEEVENIIKPFLTVTMGQKAFQKFASTNTIMLTDAVLNLQRVKLILEKIDKPIELREEMLFYQLSSVSAVELQKSLQQMQKGSLKKYLEGNTTIDVDERTNQLIIFTPPGNVGFIKKIIDKLDIAVAPLTSSAVISVSNADAKEVVTIIEKIITGQEQERKKSKDSSSTTRSNQNNTQQNTSNNTTTTTTSTPTTNSPASGSATPNLQFSEHIQIVADERSNSIVVYGTNSDIKQVEDLVDKIDILLAQVRIDMIICEIKLSDSDSDGLSSIGLGFNASTDGTSSGGNEIDLSLTTPAPGDLTPVNITASLKNFSFENVFRIVEQNDDVRIVSTPTIVTTHNKEASILIGEERPFITGTTSSLNSVNTSTQIQRENVGIELKVKPLIGANGIVQMEIEQKIEKFVRNVPVEGSGDQPILGTREASSYVSVGDGEVFVLGGLREAETNEGRSKMFFFGSIPIIGKLFRGATHVKLQTEVLLFIQPTIIRQPEEATQMLKRDLGQMKDSDQIIEQLKDWSIDTHGRRKPATKSVFE